MTMASSSSATARWKPSHRQVSHNAACGPSLLCPFLPWKPASRFPTKQPAALPPFAPPCHAAQVADTISDTDSRVSELLAYLTPRAADGTGTPLGEGCDGAVAPTAPAMRRRRRRRQVRRCPFNRCRSSSKLCDIRCHLSRDVCRQPTPGSTCHSCWMAQASSARPYADTWPALVLQPSRPPHPCGPPTYSCCYLERG